MPQLITLEEFKKVKEYVKEIGFENLKMGVMIETPASVQIIGELCKEGLDFISFGTNDLTQYILAVDRNNENVQNLYDEMHPAILYQLGYVIRVCKRNNVETSICGQSASKKEMAEYLVKQGIDSISVNADMAAEIAKHVQEVEKQMGEEPRQYQPKQKEEKKDKYFKQTFQEKNKEHKDQKNIENKQQNQYNKEHNESENNSQKEPIF